MIGMPKNYYRRSPSVDPMGPVRGQFRAFRGGSWIISPAAYGDLTAASLTAGKGVFQCGVPMWWKCSVHDPFLLRYYRLPWASGVCGLDGNHRLHPAELFSRYIIDRLSSGSVDPARLSL